MSTSLQLLGSGPAFSRLLVSVAVLGAALVAAKALQRYFARSQGHSAPDVRRGALVASRNLLYTATLALLAALWFAELRHVALSIAAIATALVITGKELVLGLIGRLLQATKRPFSVGDLVEIGGFSGQVIDIGLFSTTLLETDAARQYTGNTVELPNVLFVTTTLRNLSHTGRYVIETLRVPVPADAEVTKARDRLLACAQAVAGEHLRDARRHLRAVEADEVIALPDFQPRVLIEPKDAYQVDLVVRYAAPSARRAYLAQDVLNAYYASVAAAAAARSTTVESKGAAGNAAGAGEETALARTRIVPGAPAGAGPASLRPAS